MSHLTELDQNHTLTGADHPQTSTAAARTALGRTGSGRRRVLAAIAREPLCDEEIQDRLRMPANTQRPRRVELTTLGFIADSKLQRCTVSGAWATVWEITDAGRAALAEAA
jgi:hypothetical protein